MSLKQGLQRVSKRLFFRRFNASSGARLRLKRSALFSLAVLMAASSWLLIEIPRNARTYALDEQALSLLAPVHESVVNRYYHNEDGSYFGYNDDIITEDSADPVRQYFAQLGAGEGGIEASKIYGARLAEDSEDGLLLFNNNMKLSMRVVPNFETKQGGVHEDGYFVYPLKDRQGSLVYTPVINGFKEDIILPESPENGEITYSYTLEYGDFLEARMEDDGAIGIYSADPAFFDETTFGANSDLEETLALRTSAEKNFLVFYIPAPEIRQFGDAPLDHGADIHFELDGDQLDVVSTNLQDLSYPITIDPTLSVTSDADFAEGSNLGFIGYPSGAIDREELNGGALMTATNDDSLGAARAEGGLAFYNDYAYYVGGTSNGSDYQTTVYRSAVGGSGNLGSWSALTGDDLLDTATRGHAVVEYNGYMYAIGGEVSGNTAVTTVHYVDFQSSGAIGNWQTTTALPSGRDSIAAVAYNGYMYAIGGQDGGTYHDDVYVAPINAVGTLGSWTSLDLLPANRAGHDVFVSNGALYVVGGTDGTVRDTVYYAYLNDDGTLEGGWQTDAEPLLDATSGTSATTYNGYGYAIGGGNTSSVAQTWNQYTPLNADGTVSLWANSDDDLNTARREHSSAAYKGYVYSAGGINGSGTYQSSVERFEISTAGEISEIVNQSTMPTSKQQFGSTTYNGYIYVAGGSSSEYRVVYSAKINDDGTIGSWTTEANMNDDHLLPCMTSLNGYVYVINGWRTSGTVFIDTVEYNNIESDGTLGSSWTTTTNLPEHNSGNSVTDAYVDPQCVSYNGRVYVFAGRYQTSTGSFGPGNYKIYYATPNADGSISSWTTNSNNLPCCSPNLGGQGRHSFVYDDRLYLLDSTDTKLYYNDFASDGSLDGTWTAVTGTYNRTRGQSAVGVWNGFVYVAVGWAGGTDLHDDVEYGKIEEDGDITSFTLTNAIPYIGSNNQGGLRGAEMVLAKGQMNIIGGYNRGASGGGEQLDEVQVATIGAGGPGTSGAFTGGTDLGTAIAEHCTVSLNGYIYRIGGDTGSGSEVATVDYSSLDADGSNNTWTATSVLPEARAGHACLVYNGRIYVTGGTNASGTRTSTIYFTEPSGDGTISSWDTTTSFTTDREDHQVVAWNDYMYIMGGDTSTGTTDTVYYATIDTSGTVGSWTSTTAMDTQRENFAAVAFGGYIYAIGGNDDGTRLATVEYAEPNSGTGAIPGSGTGDWIETAEMIDPTEGMQAFAVNGFLYVVGGLYTNDSSTTVVDDRVKTAYIVTTGILDGWSVGEDLGVARWDHGATVENNRIYVTGGWTNTGGSTDTTDVEYAGLKSIARIGIYSKVIDLGERFRITDITYTGTVVNGGSINFDFRAACTDGVFSGQNYYEDLTASESAAISVNGRYVLMIVEIDDSRAIGYHDTDQSSITQVDLEYQYGWTEPDARLRGGNYFTSGEEQPYDSIEELAGGVVPCD